MMHHRIPTEHKMVSYRSGQLQRSASPYFNPPAARGMREPGTNYLTIITAPEPLPVRHLMNVVPARNQKKK
jgi:hypothetical protein